jgi:hypothetical protein
MEHVEVCADLDHVSARAKPLAASAGEASIGGCVVRKKATLKTNVAFWAATRRMPLGRATCSHRNGPPSSISVRLLRLKLEDIGDNLSSSRATPAWGYRPEARRRAAGGFGILCPQSGNTEAFTTKHLAGKLARARQPVP